MNRDERERFARIIREHMCKKQKDSGLYKSGSIQRAFNAIDALIAAGAFTPDQPAPTEDEVRPDQMMSMIRALTEKAVRLGSANHRDLVGDVEQVRAIAAGYRRHPDRRPTRSELEAINGNQFTVVSVFIDDLIAVGYAVPDPPEPERVPEFASVHEVAIRTDDVQSAHDLLLGLQLGENWQRVYELRQRLAHVLHAAQEGRDD